MERNNTSGNFQVPDTLIGSYRTFGTDGVLYEVLGIEENNPEMANILVVESGEKTRYPLKQLMADPVAY